MNSGYNNWVKAPRLRHSHRPEGTTTLRNIIAIGLVMAVSAVLTVLCSGGRGHANRVALNPQDASTFKVSRLGALLAQPVEDLARVDIARMNLLCAQDLPGSGPNDLDGPMASLDQMAVRVRAETDRHLYRYQQHAEQFEHSEGFFRMLLLAVVLTEDFQVRYAPGKIGTAAEARVGDGFFGDAHDVFLHGLTGQRREGTCSSLPVLQVAVGRRLGYPLKLVTTKGHLFVRWDDGRERFNIEATGKGVNRFADEYYRHWPLDVSEEEVRTERYLESLTSAEELAVFMSIRGQCWRENGEFKKAADSFREAARLAPAVHSYGILAAQMEDLGKRTRTVAEAANTTRGKQ